MLVLSPRGCAEGSTPIPSHASRGEPSGHEEGGPWLPGARWAEGPWSLPVTIARPEGEPVIP